MSDGREVAEQYFAAWHKRLSRDEGEERPFIRVEFGRVAAASHPDGEIPDGYYVQYEGV